MIHSAFIFSQGKKITSQPGGVSKNCERNQKVCSGMHHSYYKLKMGLNSPIRIYFYTFCLFNSSILKFMLLFFNKKDGIGRTFYF